METLGFALLGWALSATLMTACWAWHLRVRNAAVVDVGWAASLMLLSLVYAAIGPGWMVRRWVMAAMFVVWGGRLSLYLLRERVLDRPEDARYADLRERNSPAAAFRFYPFFQAQALLAVLLSTPALLVAFNVAPRFAPIEIAALVLWAGAFVGESLADRQLARFKVRPESGSTTCREGLWRFSRHPNYFFEWVVWVAYALFASASPWGILALACPALMLYLLFRVTGIPATEAQAVRRRGDDYRRYQATTSVFVPMRPRQVQS